MPLVVTDRVVIPDDDLEVAFSRSGGSGGQNVNKVSSKVLLRFHLDRCAVLTPGAKARLRAACPSRLTDDGDLLVTSDRERDQKQNLEDARSKEKSHRGDITQGRGRVGHDD
jgi:ribosome-associated protein